MLIDQNISNLNKDGELLINFRPHRDVQIKIGTWDQGLPFFSKKKGQWVHNHYQSRVTLVTDEHIKDKSLPVHQYLNKAPHWIIDKTKIYKCKQFYMLQALSNSSQARVLFEHSPNLLWLLVIEKFAYNWSSKEFEDLLKNKRSYIIKRVFNIPENQQVVKFINKIQLNDGNKTESELIKQIIINQDHKLINAFHHWKVIPTHVLAITEKFPNLIACRVLEEARDMSEINIVYCLNVYSVTDNIIEDIE